MWPREIYKAEWKKYFFQWLIVKLNFVTAVLKDVLIFKIYVVIYFEAFSLRLFYAVLKNKGK